MKKIFNGKFLHYIYNLSNLDNIEWINKQKQRLHNLNINKEIKENKNLIELVYKLNDKIKIVDFGGSLGFSFLALKNVPETRKKNIEYHIIETNGICNIGQDLFKNKITFHNSIDKTKNVDILYIKTSLQYAENWYDTLDKFIAFLKPQYFLFENLSAGKIETFTTLQRWQNHLVPYKFINIDEIKSLLNACDYCLKKEEDCIPIDDKFYSDDIEPNCRLSCTKTLLFAREERKK